jgi:hypothetical protein
MKKVPLRTCVITKEKCEKRLLLRVVRTPEGNVIFDKSGKANGKGAYVKKDKDVILKAQKTKILDNILEVKVPDTVYEELLKEVASE